MSEIHDDLDRVGRQRRAAAEARDAAAEATEQVIVRALKESVRPSDIAKRLDVTDSFVRKIRAAHNLPADPRYATVKPPARKSANETREEVAATGRPRGERIRSLDRAGAARLVERASNGTDDGWAERVTAGQQFRYEVERFRFLVGVALDEGLLKDSDLPD
jgi:hypothetical protein